MVAVLVKVCILRIIVIGTIIRFSGVWSCRRAN